MDPVEFILKNMTRKPRDETPYTNYTLDECIRRGAEVFDWKKRWRPQPGSDAGPIKRGAGVSFMAFRVGRRPQQRRRSASTRKGKYTRARRRHRRRRRREDDDGPDRGRGARRAAVAGRRRVGRHRSLSVLGRRVRQPHHDHDRLRRGRSGARSEEADRREGHADRQRRADRVGDAATRRSQGKVRNAFGAHFVEVEVDTELGRVRVTKYLAVHDCGRIMNPLTATQPDQGRRDHGHRHGAARGPALRPRAAAQPLTAGYYGARIATHRDAPEIEVIFIETDDGYGPFGAKSMGESSKVPAPAAVGNAVFNAIGVRMKDLPITRDKILGALRMKTFTNANAARRRSRRSRWPQDARKDGQRVVVRRRRQRSARHGQGAASSRPTSSSA